MRSRAPVSTWRSPAAARCWSAGRSSSWRDRNRDAGGEVVEQQPHADAGKHAVHALGAAPQLGDGGLVVAPLRRAVGVRDEPQLADAEVLVREPERALDVVGELRAG